jgi:hypothetical protein
MASTLPKETLPGRRRAGTGGTDPFIAIASGAYYREFVQVELGGK